MKKLIPLMILITTSASYVVYDLYLSLIGQPTQPPFTALAIAVLLASSYYITTGRVPFWSEEEEA
ncbi:hypothetical protein [Exiguobacterium sp.]|uniref:hypothetical protein n=1 Tax=Exiguobacterium sp. TaxID=44751 RepID=UPI00307F6718